MLRRPVLAFVFVGALVASACGAGSTPDHLAVEAPPASSVPGPDGVLDTTGGSTFAFEEVVGEPTVLWFWGPG